MSTIKRFIRQHHSPVDIGLGLILATWFVLAEYAIFQQWILH